MRFANRIVVIIGGNSGIGRAAAEAFAAEGGQVIITGRDQKTLDEVAGGSQGKIVAMRSDVLRSGELLDGGISVITEGRAPAPSACRAAASRNPAAPGACGR